jgi:hypothetical protein
MAQCENGIFKNIESNCSNRTSAGIEQTVYIINRDDIENVVIASDEDYNKITGFDMKAGKTAYTAKGFKRNLTAGFERVVSDDTVDTWKDSLTLTGYEFDSASARNFDNIGNVFAIIERKGTKEGDGSFIALGYENGLFVSEDSWAAGDNNGARTVTLSNLDDAGESCSYYVICVETGTPAAPNYEATKAFLESLVTA